MTSDLGFTGRRFESRWASLCNGLGQATYTDVPLSPSSVIWYQPSEVISLVGKVSTGMVESIGILPPGL